MAIMAGVGLSGDDLWPTFNLTNLMKMWPGKKSDKGDDFDMGEAREAVEVILMGLERRPPSYVLLMGRKVQQAFRLKELKYLERYAINRFPLDRHRVIVFPHPSGLNQWYNDQDNVKRASQILRRVVEVSERGQSEAESG